ncbi:hypothetical protein NMY22_g616 [Coprinellus aureogranulatus]|nr:hypothetical protein NMY22_g616 [Coprinellus aureogranulatus]
MSRSIVRKEHWEEFMAFYGDLLDEFLPMELVEGPPVSCFASRLLQLVDDTRKEIPPEAWTEEAWVKYLCKTFPRKSLPAKLSLKLGLNYQPPRFLFGWAVEATILDSIMEYCGCSEVTWYKPPVEASVILSKILRERFPRLMEDLGCVLIHPVVTYDGDMPVVRMCIALADSWITGNHKPSTEHIETLREFFGIGTGDLQALADNQPMWWMDLLAPRWEYCHEKERLRDFRPWDLEASAFS